MSWKQPIPTDLNYTFGDDYLSKHIYIELLLRAKISEQAEPKRFAKSLFFLEVGQCVCGLEELAEEFGVDSKTIKKSLENLKNAYGKVEYKATSKGHVITIKNFKEVTKMENKTDGTRNTSGKQVDTNQSDKKDKTDKKAETFKDRFNSLTGKSFRTSRPWARNFNHWLEVYSEEEILRAVSNAAKSKWYQEHKDVLTPDHFLTLDKDLIGKYLEVRGDGWDSEPKDLIQPGGGDHE